MVIVTITTDIPAIETVAPEEYLVDFLNTVDLDLGTDVLDEPAEYIAWARERGVAAGDLADARRVRDALRAVTAGSTCDLPEVSLSARITPEGVTLTGDTAATSAVAIATGLTSVGRFSRVKLCLREDCGWAFYDRSRNGSRTWCSMEVCGNRVKAKTFREKGIAAD
jgi:predicted RNA-binding Zn ribbon-like protein